MQEFNKMIIYPKPGRYILAVSGGVDSVVLLEVFAKMMQKNNYKLVVAHLDHGIRKSSYKDCELVALLAKKYGFSFESKKLSLGEDASEEEARRERYEFLLNIAKKHNADAVLTAQHRDDAIETLVFNAVRGAEYLGLSPFLSNKVVQRPLIKISKEDITIYAKKNKLEWREDETNKHATFARNYIRNELLPVLEQIQPGSKKQLAKLVDEFSISNQELLNQNSNPSQELKRSKILELSSKKVRELLSFILLYIDPEFELTKAQLLSLEHFVKTAHAGKIFTLSSTLQVSSGSDTVKIYNPTI